jgi:nucleolar protein 56
MNEGWYAGLAADDQDAHAAAITEGSAESPAEWPDLAVTEGFVDDTEQYYDRLRAATIQATRTAVRAAERSDDQQLIHAVRAMDDCEREANELAERVAEWGGSRYDETGTGIEYARELASRDAETPTDKRLVALAERVTDLAGEATRLREYVERTTPQVAPNLSALAGSVLAARLIALAGGLESLAKKPSGTVQVLGAEDALFAHLQGNAPSPKHGVIYTHEYVRGTAREQRGSAARALAGKLSIAARVDHYSGEQRPELEAELDERIERIRARDSA